MREVGPLTSRALGFRLRVRAVNYSPEATLHVLGDMSIMRGVGERGVIFV